MNPRGAVAAGKQRRHKPTYGSDKRRRTRRPVETSTDRNGPYEDLCSTCQKRERCPYPRPHGGVWHCVGYC